MEKLKQQLNELMRKLENAEDFQKSLTDLVSIAPFNEFEYVISHLLAEEKLTIDEYHKIRSEYIARHSANNRYLHLFEMSGKLFGGWAERHISEIAPSLKRLSKKIQKSYSGDYDLILPPEIRIEVKSSRATDAKSKLPALSQKALAFESNEVFDMNFQQIKPRCCDVFILLAVWRDVIKYWVIASHEIENNRRYSGKQHRGNTGEGQMHLKPNNIREFDDYLVEPYEIESAVRIAFDREKQARNL